MKDCLFCKIVNGEMPADIVYQDEQVLVFKDIYPKAETHLLIVPKLHYSHLPQIADANPQLLSDLMQKIPEIAKQQQLEGFRTIINTGKEGGQVVFHLHAHILGGKNLPGF